MKVCVVTTEYSLATNIALKKLVDHKALKRHKVEIVSIVSTNHVNPLTTEAWVKFGKFVKKSGFWFTLKYMGLNTWQKVNLKINRLFIPLKKRELFEVSELCRQNKIQYLTLNSVNTPEFKKYLEKNGIEVLVSCLLLEKVKADILDTPPQGSINFHPGLFDQHRGTFSGFWALFNKRQTAGATIHFMTPNFDEGEILSQQKFRVKAHDSMNCVNEKSAKIGGRLMAQTLVKIKKKQVKAQKIKKWSPLFSMPNTKQVNAFTKAYYLVRARDWWRV